MNIEQLETEPLCLSIWDSKRVVYERIAGGWGREKRSVENLEYFKIFYTLVSKRLADIFLSDVDISFVFKFLAP